ncbi:unnamed protein product [Linum trigynum]|uniref:Retrotransposon gag domain-containing protein n=1 Tax=Linum trigynum TaxID=586398 RepID=A0AAV2E371_9ROSI
MIDALGSKNKLGFIDRSIPKPAAGDSMAWPWTSCNTVVKSWILQSVDEVIGKSVRSIQSAAEVWKTLKLRYAQGDLIRIVELKEKLCTLKQGRKSLSEYHTHLVTIWEELRNYQSTPPCLCTTTSHSECEAIKTVKAHEETNLIVYFLRGLNENYSIPRSQVLFTEPLPTMDQIFYKMAQHDRQMTGNQQDKGKVVESLALALQSLGLKLLDTQRTEWNYSPASGTRGRGRGRGRSPGSRPFCTYCKMHGHTEDTCYHKHGWPHGMSPRGRGTEQGTYRPANVAVSTDSSSEGVMIQKDQYESLMNLLKAKESNGSSSSQPSTPPTH